MNKHPKVKTRYEKMMRDAEEKGRLKREERERKKQEKAGKQAKSKKK